MDKSEEIFKEFKEHSVAEFFKKNRQMLGFSGKTRSLTTIVHEYVTNSLDACEEARILPEISIEIKETGNEQYLVKAEDNGSGIPVKHLGKALGMMLAGTKFHRYVQQRGQQGIGATGCTMYAQITTGKPITISSFYDKKAVHCNLSIDFKTNSPRITNQVAEDQAADPPRHGLLIEAEFAEVKYDRSAYGVYEYIKRTALANPHAQFTLLDPEGERFSFPRSVEKIPPKPQVVKPHPLGIATDDLINFAHYDKESTRISSFLQEAFTRVSAEKVKELLALTPEINFKKAPRELQWPEAQALVAAFKKVKWIAPATDSVVPIGEEQIKKSLTNILSPQLLAVVERSPKVYRGGVPFVVEVGLAYGGSAGREIADKRRGDVLRYANRAPLLFDSAGCALTEAVKGVDWKRYGIKDFEEEPITVFVNLASVHIPYTGAGKQAIALEEDIVAEVKNAVMEAARQLKLYLGGIVREKKRATRQKVILRYIPQLSRDLAELSAKGSPSKIEKKLAALVEERFSSGSEGDEEEEGAEEGEDLGGEEDFEE